MSSPNQVPIPGPRGVPFLGNIYDIEPEVPTNSFELLADNYGMDLDIHSHKNQFRGTKLRLIYFDFLILQAQSSD